MLLTYYIYIYIYIIVGFKVFYLHLTCHFRDSKKKKKLVTLENCSNSTTTTEKLYSMLIQKNK